MDGSGQGALDHDAGTPVSQVQAAPATFALLATLGDDALAAALGQPDYSYRFSLRLFAPVLARIGEAVAVRDLAEAQAVHDEAAARGRAGIVLAFMPPHQVPVGLRCPVIPVFPWEFSTLPDEAWEGDARHDWRTVLGRVGRAVVQSSHTADVVRAAMGADYPVAAIPAPVWDRFAPIGVRAPARPVNPGTALRCPGTVVDSLAPAPALDEPPAPVSPPPAAEIAPESAPESAAEIGAEPARRSGRERLSLTWRYAVGWYRDVVRDALPRPVAAGASRAGRLAYRGWSAVATRPAEPVPPAPAPPEPPPPCPETVVALAGVVYASVLNPADGRKNWFDLVTAFCWALRDAPDATLVLKMVHTDRAAWQGRLATLLAQLAPFRCRVVALDGYLDDAAYAALVAGASYYANASNAEGLCLPLMEFMAAGRPAIAPCHTAMLDYVDSDCAFTVASGIEHNVWPHDPRDLFRTLRHRIEWSSLRDAYAESYRVAKEEPGRYRAMGRAAGERIRAHASEAVVEERLRAFFAQMGLAAGDAPCRSPEGVQR